MRPHRAAPVLLLALALAGCGDGGGDDPGAEVSSGQDVADLIGCEGFSADSEEMFVTEGGSCTLDGEEVQAYYFADRDALDSYLEVAGGFGGQYLYSDQWAVGAPPAVLEDLQGDVGGEISGD